MNFVKDKGFAGSMTWAIDMDDFQGVCGQKDVLIDVLFAGRRKYSCI